MSQQPPILAAITESYIPEPVKHANALPEKWRDRFSDLLKATPATNHDQPDYPHLHAKIYRRWTSDDVANATKALAQVLMERHAQTMYAICQRLRDYPLAHDKLAVVDEAVEAATHVLDTIACDLGGAGPPPRTDDASVLADIAATLRIAPGTMSFAELRRVILNRLDAMDDVVQTTSSLRDVMGEVSMERGVQWAAEPMCVAERVEQLDMALARVYESTPSAPSTRG